MPKNARWCSGRARACTGVYGRVEACTGVQGRARGVHGSLVFQVARGSGALRSSPGHPPETPDPVNPGSPSLDPPGPSPIVALFALNLFWTYSEFEN